MIACRDMVSTFEAAMEFIADNPAVWQQAAVKRAETAIHFQLNNAARVALNSTRPMRDGRSFARNPQAGPPACSGDVVQFVDAMGGNTVATPTKDFSWVNPATDARTDVMGAAQGFATATNVEDAPGSGELIGRGWIRNIP